MGLYTQPNNTNGQSGEWAPIREVSKLRYWDSWRGKLAFLFPVERAFIGLSPNGLDDPQEIIMDSATLMTADYFERRNGIIDRETGSVHSGTHAYLPIVYDESQHAFGEILDENEEEIHHLWIPDDREIHVLSHDRPLPYINKIGHMSEMSTAMLRVDHL